MSKANKRAKLLQSIRARWQIYLLLILPIGLLILFAYVPMGGIVIAFKRYNFALGIFGSPWVGLDNFRRFLESPYFFEILRNTLTLSFYSLFVGFPFPIIFALFLNALPWTKYQKTIQTITYIPNFFSNVIMVGLVFQILNSRTGLYGSFMYNLTGNIPPDLLAVGTGFKHIYIWSGIWQGTGFGSIIYFAALSNVDPELHEAALVDGATRFQRVLHIDIPTLLPTVSILLILRVGGIMSTDFEKVLLMQNSLNIAYSEVIATYVYKIGLASQRNDFSFSTAIGLFNNVINFLLLLSANWISRKLSGSGLF
jgi:ABC-type polysaccharide transport system permease subunit